jgi:hypothetical protein
MSRFSPLFVHFEQNVGKLLHQLQMQRPELTPEKLVYSYSYREGVYRVYEKTDHHDHTWGPKITEVNPAQSLTSLREIWFFSGDKELEAFVEYQPDYRPDLRVADIHLPLLQLRVIDVPKVSGLH